MYDPFDFTMEAMRKRLYVYKGEDRVTNDGRAMLLKGDVMFRMTDSGLANRFTSGRGASRTYAEDEPFMDRDLEPALDENAGPEELERVLRKMDRQSRYEDAGHYLKSPDGMSAVACYNSSSGPLSVVRDWQSFTLKRGNAGFEDWKDCSALSFNPGRVRIDTVSADVPEDKGKKSLLARVGDVVRKLGSPKPASKSDNKSPVTPLLLPFDRIADEAGFKYEGFDRLVSLAADKVVGKARVPSYEPGMALVWRERVGPGHGLGAGASAEHFGVVVRNENGSGMRVMPAVAKSGIDGGLPSVSIPSEGPFRDRTGLAVLPEQCWSMTSAEASAKSVKILPGGRVNDNLLARLQRLDPLPAPAFKSPAVRLHEKHEGAGAYARMKAMESRDDGNKPQAQGSGPDLEL